MKKFLLVQTRPEDEAADNELHAFLNFGGLQHDDIHRIQADREPIPDVNLDHYAGVIVGGGPSNFSDAKKTDVTLRMERDIYRLLDQVIDKDVPYLGACYGFGGLVAHQGGVVSKENYSEDVGATTINLTDAGKLDPLTMDLPLSFRAFGGHKEAAQTLPISAVLLASSVVCPVQMIRVKNNVYATQFHPELDTNGIIVRINVYRHAGYFPPESADELISLVEKEDVTVPIQILQNFVQKYL